MDVMHQRIRAGRIQAHWAGNARADMRYNQQQARRDRSMGNFTLARLHQREANWDRFWLNRRMNLVKKYNR